MSKHKPATASKHIRRPKIAAKAQRAKQVIVRSPKDSSLRSVTEGSTESPPERHNDSPQEASLVQNPATAAQDDFKQTIRDNDSTSGFDFSSATANVRAYQEKLIEMTQTNMAVSFEFSQAMLAAEIISLSVVDVASRSALGLHGHPADGVSHFGSS